MSDRTVGAVLRNERQCLRKKAYLSMTDAHIVAVKVAKKRGTWLRAYHCPNCRWYHLTKTSPRAA